MKKVFIVLLIGLLMLCVTACGDTSEPVVNNTTAATTTSTTLSSDPRLTIADVQAAPVTDESLFKVREIEGGVTITKFTGTNEIVVIPETVGGKKVVAISGNSFANNTTMRGIKIADSIHTLGEASFVNSSALEIVIMGSGMKTLSRNCFAGCDKLTTAVLNDGLESITCAFGGASFKRVEMPSSIKHLDYPIVAHSQREFCVIVAEAGSYVEQYVKENGEKQGLVFEAK